MQISHVLVKIIRQLLKLKYILLICLVVCSNLTHSQSYDSILFLGRFDFKNPAVPTFSHVGSSIKANFTGTGIAVKLSSIYKTGYIQVIVDGNDAIEHRRQIEVSNTAAVDFVLAEGLEEGNHSVELVKTDQYDTKLAFHGFVIENGGLNEKPDRLPLSIEFYGDSNPAGHSAWDPYDRGAAFDNGGYYTYPAITARLLSADHINISMGGSGITNKAWRNLIDFHHLLHMDEAVQGSNIWDYTSNHLGFEPDAVVINLGANDYYSSAGKNEIMTGWKSFISENLRTYYPNAHIVLANSYGWAFDEPADYVHEAVEELKQSGDENISYIRFPWLWGQEHAVINEHAGFANLLALHLAKELKLPQPGLSELSSFVEPGELYNGNFEISSISDYADGWRPHGNDIVLQTADGEAYDGDNYFVISNNSWSHGIIEAKEGDIISISAMVRKRLGSGQGKLKIEFKDQGQNTIKSSAGLFTAADEWRQTKNSMVAPKGTWAAWIIIEAESSSTVDFDLVEVVNSTNLSHRGYQDYDFCIFPNPCTGNTLNIQNDTNTKGIVGVYNLSGVKVLENEVAEFSVKSIEVGGKLTAGLYHVQVENDKSLQLFKLVVR